MVSVFEGREEGVVAIEVVDTDDGGSEGELEVDEDVEFPNEFAQLYIDDARAALLDGIIVLIFLGGTIFANPVDEGNMDKLARRVVEVLISETAGRLWKSVFTFMWCGLPVDSGGGGIKGPGVESTAYGLLPGTGDIMRGPCKVLCRF